MRRLLIFWLGLAAILLGGCKEEPQAADGAAPPAPALWLIERNGRKAWLFGTVHLLPRGIEWENPVIAKAAAQSDLLVLEAAGLDNEKRTSAIFEQLGKSPGLPDIAERVPEGRRAALSALMDRIRISDRMLTSYESWAAALLLSSSVQEDLKLEAGEGIERQLSRQFLDEGKAVVGLETVEQQLGIFDALPEAAQRAFLMQVVDDAGSAADQYRIMLEAWRRGDMKRIGRAFLTEFSKTPALLQPLLFERNRNWSQQIAALMKKPRTPFIAVGAGHMTGPHSLQANLTKQGFAVKRIQ